MPTVDAAFGEPRLAAVYDAIDDDRRDLDAYLGVAEELGARTAVDLGCGTGVLALLLAGRGLRVTGVDPAAASLAVARAKPGAAAVRWVDGDATAIPPERVDLVTMTGNAAQAVVDDQEWDGTLRCVRRALADEGVFVFETRDPSARAWEGWAAEVGHERRVDAGPAGTLRVRMERVEVAPPFVEFVGSTLFESDGARFASRSRLRFRERSEVEDDLRRAGLRVLEVRDAPDRPGLELVFLAVRDGR